MEQLSFTAANLTNLQLNYLYWVGLFSALSVFSYYYFWANFIMQEAFRKMQKQHPEGGGGIGPGVKK